MKMTLKAVLLASASIFAASALSAQQADLPNFLKGSAGLEFQGQVSGMDLYSMDGFEGLWLVSPDGRTAIAGTIFSGDGRDIGAAFTGGDPVRYFENGNEGSAELSSAGITPVNSGSSFGDPNTPVLTDEELSAMESGVSRIEEDIFGARDAQGEATTDVVSTSALDADQITSDAQTALDGMSDEDKTFLMTALVAMLQDVNSEAEFKSVVQVWTDEVVQRHRNGETGAEVVEGQVTGVDPIVDIPLTSTGVGRDPP